MQSGAVEGARLALPRASSSCRAAMTSSRGRPSSSAQAQVAGAVDATMARTLSETPSASGRGIREPSRPQTLDALRGH